jgi:hypothetical protein
MLQKKADQTYRDIRSIFRRSYTSVNLGETESEAELCSEGFGIQKWVSSLTQRVNDAKQSYTERISIFRRSDTAVTQRAKESEAELQSEGLGIPK